MINIFKRHYLALILASLLGILMVLPFFYFQIKLGPEFQGIWPAVVDDQNFYLTRIKDVIDGHPLLSNAYLYEHKNELPQQVFLAEWLLAQPLKLFGISISTGHLVYNFLFSVIAFLLAYTAFYLILRRKFWSLLFSIFLFFGLYPLAFIRPVSPQFNFIFWLTQFVFLWLLVNKRGSTRIQERIYTDNLRKSANNQHLSAILVLNILNFGLLFYIYPYYWTYYLIFFLIFIALNFLNSKYFHNSNYGSKQIIKIIVGGLILAIPYFYLNYLSAQLPYYTETLTRLGMIYSHFPSGFRIIFWSALGFAAFSRFLWRKVINWDVKTIFFISGILASVIAVNQHLITGRNLEFSSHYDMAAMFFLVFAAAYLIGNYLNKLPNTTIQRCIVVFIVLITTVEVFYGLFGYSQRVFAIDENAVYRQNYAPIFDWLNKNTEKDSVVYANADLSRLIPVYTASNVFYVREANLFFISDEEVLDRFILNNFFEKFDRNFVVENVRAIYGVRYIDTYGHAVQGNKLRKILGLKPEPEVYLPDEAIQKVLKRAHELQKGDFLKELSAQGGSAPGGKKYRVDYLVWDKNKNPNWRINLEFFKPVFQDNGLIIFKIVL